MQTVTLEEIHRDPAILDRALEQREPVEIFDHGKIAETLVPAPTGDVTSRNEREFPISKDSKTFGIAEVSDIEREPDPR